MEYKYTVEKICENIEIAEGIYELTIEGSFIVTPGQFFMIRGWRREPLLARPISVCNVEGDKISFVYAIVGEGTELLSKLGKNEKIEILGPLGKGFDIENIKGKVAVVTGGIGIAPMVYVLKSLKNCAVDLYAGFRKDSFIVDNVEENVNNFQLSTENGKMGHKGYVTDQFNPQGYDVVLSCGPEIMMEKVIKECRKKKVPVFVSMEKHMACGIGACLVCTCKTKSGNRRTCKDGPVFSGEEIVLDDES